MSFPDFLDHDSNEYAKAIREGQPFKEVIRDKGELYLRVTSVFPVGGEKLTVVCSEPLDKKLVADIAANLGEITLYAAGITLDDRTPNEQNSSGEKASLKSPSAMPKQKNG